MSTAAQVSANRANAQFSTGPRSVEGKASSGRNALKFGIHAKSLVIPGEDPEELDALAREYDHDLAPQGPIESALVETLVRSTWMLRRLSRIEAEVLRAQMTKNENSGECRLGDAYIEDAAGSRVLESIARRHRAAQRDYFTALKLLRELQQTTVEDEIFSTAIRQAAAMPPRTATPPENRVRFSNSASVPCPPLDNPALRL